MKILMAMDMPYFSDNDELLSDGKFGGGSATVAYNLCLKLVEMGHKVEIVCPGVKYYDFQKENLAIKFRPELNINFKNNLRILGTSKSAISYKRIYRIFKKLFSQRCYDILHTHSPHLSVGPSMAAHEMGVPTIVTLHNYWPICYFNDLAINGKICDNCNTHNFVRCLLTQNLSHKCLLPIHMLLRNSSMRLRKQSLNKVNFIISVSNYSKNVLSLSKVLVNDKIFWIPNMYEVNLDISKIYNRIPPNRFIWAGRIIKSKGLIYLLKALKLLAADYPEVELIIVGDGPEKKQMKLFAKRNNIHKNIIFAGWISQNELIEHITNSLALIATSILPETLNMTLIEAMGNGVPVISTNIGAPFEYLEHESNGLLYKPGNYKELAKHMKFFIKNKSEAKKMGLTGFHMVKDKFSPEIVVQKHLNLYNKAILNN